VIVLRLNCDTNRSPLGDVCIQRMPGRLSAYKLTLNPGGTFSSAFAGLGTITLKFGVAIPGGGRLSERKFWA
jgi:hypothetical protein